MKLIKNRIQKCKFIFIFLLLPLLVSADNEDNQKWELTLELEKPEYVLYERIWLDVSLKNITSDSVRTRGIPAPNHLGFRVVLKDKTGTELKYTGWLYLFGSSRGHIIMQGENEYQFFDLLSQFDDSKTKRNYYAPWGYFNYLPVGKYSVQVEFEGGVSNILSFDIVEPTGSELDALMILGKAYEFPTDGEYMHLVVPIYKELVEKYPNSVYADKCYELMVYTSTECREARSNGTFDKRSYEIEMLEKFPNSGDCTGRLEWIKRKLEDKNEILNRILKDYPNTRAGKFSKQILKQMKQEEMLKQKEEE